MKTFQTSEESKRIAARSQHSEFEFRPLPNPSKAARLSLIPGLGQFYNGQKRKGALFLAAALASYLLLLALSSGQTIVNFIAPVAGLFNLKLNAAMASNMAVSPWVVLISWCLYLSFVAYAVRDAYDHAAFIRKRATAPRFMLGLAEAASGSYLAHFTVIATFLIAILFLLSPKPPSQQITDIELMPQAEQHRAPKTNKPKNNPAPKAAPKPEPPKQVTPPPPKPQPPKPVVAPPVKAPPIPVAPISVKSNEPSPNTVPVAPSAPAPSSSSSGQPTGSASGSGQSTGEDSGDDQDIDFGPYLAAMQRRIKKAWFPPKGNESKRVTLKFDIQRDGSVTKVRMVTSSGVQVVDDAAIQAVQNAAPFAPLPKGSPDELDIKFTFDYNVFNGTGRSAFHQF